MTPPLQQLLQEQIAYYRARAGEYDEWFLRTGRYDRGPEENHRWFAEIAEVGKALATRLADLGWQVEVHATPSYFLHGRGGIDRRGNGRAQAGVC